MRSVCCRSVVTDVKAEAPCGGSNFSRCVLSYCASNCLKAARFLSEKPDISNTFKIKTTVRGYVSFQMQGRRRYTSRANNLAMLYHSPPDVRQSKTYSSSSGVMGPNNTSKHFSVRITFVLYALREE